MRLNLITCFGTVMAHLGKGSLWKPAPTEKITDQLYAINDKGDVNLFVYTDGENTIKGDVGSKTTYGIRNQPLKYIIRCFYVFAF